MIRVLKDMTCEGGLAEDSMIPEQAAPVADQQITAIFLETSRAYEFFCHAVTNSVITHSVRTKVYLNHPTDRNTQNQIRLKSIRLAMVLPHECWTHAKPQSNSKTVDPFQKLNGMLSR